MSFHVHRTAISLAPLALACACTLTQAADIDPQVLAAARQEGAADVLIFLADQSRPQLAPLAADADYRLRRRVLVDALRARADHQQADLRAWLDARDIPYRAFWISNAIRARVPAAELSALAARDGIARVAMDAAVPLALPQVRAAAAPQAPSAVEWGIERIRAPEVWADGHDGSGVVIAGQDTGYDWDHPALKSHYRGWDGSSAIHDHNWHDAIHDASGNSCGNDAMEPCDDHGHGTHTAGTFAGGTGSNVIGVAPGAKWIGCRNMASGWGTPARYIECMEWFLAPTDLDGNDPDPDLAPHVINNSWGCPPEEGCTVGDELADAVDTLVDAGIFFVASAGNDGSGGAGGCGTIFSPPAIHDSAFVVGSTTSSDRMSTFSSRGPVPGSALIRPDVSAPGSGIRSAVPGGGYGDMSGTSMAGPHVAGAAALVMSANPALQGNPVAVAQILRETAVPIDTQGQSCGGIGADEWPNHVAGYGRIDAYAAVMAAMAYVDDGIFEDGFDGAPGAP